jgi:predicted lipid-binding transport protein (Tim44 family)
MTEEIIKYDNNFNESEFISKVDRIFIMFLDSIMHKDISMVDHYANEKVCSYASILIDEYTQKNVIRLFDEANIKSTKICDFKFIDNKYVIKVELVSRYKDYIIDDNGNYISGVEDHRIETTHTLTFEKNANALDTGVVTMCTNCGNSINANENGVCSFCNKVYNMEKYEYILTDIDTFRNL